MIATEQAWIQQQVQQQSRPQISREDYLYTKLHCTDETALSGQQLAAMVYECTGSTFAKIMSTKTEITPKQREALVMIRNGIVKG